MKKMLPHLIHFRQISIKFAIKCPKHWIICVLNIGLLKNLLHLLMCMFGVRRAIFVDELMEIWLIDLHISCCTFMSIVKIGLIFLM